MQITRVTLAALAVCSALNTPLHAQDMFATPQEAQLGRRVGDLDATATLRLVLALPLADKAGAEAFARRVLDHSAQDYGHFLTPAGFAARFGANAADYQALRQWASENGLTPGAVTSSRTTLSVSGTVAQVERVFATRLTQYRTAAGEDAFAPSVAPTLPQALAGRVSAVIGLSSVKRFAPLFRRASASPRTAGGTGVLGAYSPGDFRAAYDIPNLGLPQAPSEVAAVFEQGGFKRSDVTTFTQRYHLPATPVVVRPVDGYDGSVNSSDVELESVLDIETLIGINPRLAKIIDYEQGTGTFQVALLDALSAMADDDLAQTISISYGNSESLQGAAAQQAEASVLTQMTAQGQAVFASSGDEGAEGQGGLSGYNVLDPASQPDVTGVGGTTLSTGPKSAYEVEIAWGKMNEFLGASGGGVSSFWPLPAYQLYEPNPGVFQSVALANGGSGTFRNVPDLAADADPTTGASVYSAANGGWLQVGGTSLASPIWAGFYTIMNEASKGIGFGPIGSFNPTHYRIAEAHSIFGGYNDILTGNNGQSDLGIAGYAAGSDFDNVTGWGSMQGADLVFSLFSTNLSKGKPPTAPHKIEVIPSETSAVLSWQAGTNVTGYFILTTQPANPKIVQEAVTRGTIVQVKGLQPGTTYVTHVYSINSHGTSDLAVFGKLYTTKSQN